MIHIIRNVRLTSFFAALLLILSLLVGCAETVRVNAGLISRLQNRGAVALSSDNPYLAANLLVSREMERSAELKGFIEHRGAPLALEVKKEAFEALTMDFYYPESREFYSLEEVDRTWVIRGPLTIPRDKMKEVATLTRDIQGNPTLTPRAIEPGPFQSYNDKAKDFYGEADASSAPTPKPDPNPSPTKLTAKAIPPPVPTKELTMNQTISALKAKGGGEAEITPKGDLVHYITYPGETLSMIARWYTDDRANAGKIARINNLSDPNQLEIGDMVVIPSYLVRNKIRMGEEVVQKLAVIGK